MKLKRNFQRIVGLKLENDLQYGSGMDAIFSGTTQSSQNLLYRTISLIRGMQDTGSDRCG